MNELLEQKLTTIVQTEFLGYMGGERRCEADDPVLPQLRELVQYGWAEEFNLKGNIGFQLIGNGLDAIPPMHGAITDPAWFV